MTQFSIRLEARGEVGVVNVSGRIDSDSAPRLDAHLAEAAGGNPRLVLDLKDLAFMSSAGIRAVIKAAQVVKKNGGALKIASAQASITSLLYTVGLDQHIGLYATVEEAIASF
jgi:anti-sigma B factor antagonist